VVTFSRATLPHSNPYSCVKVVVIYREQNWFEVCEEAADGAHAIEKAKELKPDLIILDLASATHDWCGRWFCLETCDAKRANNIVYDV
jgi:AmiR/NasT family two-component response regulator